MINSKIIQILHKPHSIEQYKPNAQQDILWPCLQFTIALRATCNKSLNIFESTLLGLLSENGRDIENLNRLMGFTSEDKQNSSLAGFLCNKLKQLDLITERLDLTDQGRQLLEKISNDETKVIGATVYYDLINKCWLPLIDRNDFSVNHLELLTNDTVEFKQGSVGAPRLIKAIPIFTNEIKIRPPNERDVIDIIRRYRQQRKKINPHSAISNYDGYVPSLGTISVNPEAELIYIHCYAFSVQGGKSFYVSDGFHSCTQERFSRAFNDPAIRARIPQVQDVIKRLRTKSHKSYERIFIHNQKSINNLYELLMNSKINNDGKRIEFENNLKEFISKSYAELEYIFADLFDFNKISKYSHLLTSDAQTNCNFALNIAKKLGFTIQNEKGVKRILKVNKGSVIHLKVEQPVMIPLLICHLIDASNNEFSPMAKLSKELPTLLDEIAQLHVWRNPIEHGDAKSILDKINDNDIEMTYRLIEKTRLILKDWIKDRVVQVSDDIIPNWYKDDIRTKAYNRLETHFELMLTRLDEKIYESLFESLIFANSIDARRRVNALAAAVQQSLYLSIQSLDSSVVIDILRAKNQLKELGIENLIKSNEYKIKSAVNGVNSTLGANFIAFWALITQYQQSDFKNKYSKLIKSIDNLDKIRGHSGEIIEQNDSLNEIETDVFKLIKILMEQYCG